MEEEKQQGADFYSDTGQPVLTMKELYREKNALVMRGALMGAWDSKIYIQPDQMLKMVGIMLKPSVIGYVLALPFHLARRKKETKNKQ